MTAFKQFINGQWCGSSSQIEVVDPATEEVIGSIACADTAQVNEAVMAARACVERGDLTNPRPAQRVRWLLAVADEIERLKPEGVPLLVAEPTWLQLKVASLWSWKAGRHLMRPCSGGFFYRRF